MRPIRRSMLRRQEQVDDVRIEGLEHLQSVLAAGQGVLITPNHYCFTDPYILAAAADRAGRPFYYMTAWQAIGLHGPARRLVMRWHGAFSIDRDGPDMQAFKQAVEILQKRPHPLVIFPEGEMYRTSDRVFPFREGTAAIALAAAKRAERQIVCLPCALRYEYLSDPTPEVVKAIARIEQRLLLRSPPADANLARRVLRAAESALSLKETEYLGQTQSGTAHDRARKLAEAVLAPIEQRSGVTKPDSDLLARVRIARQRTLAAMEKLEPTDPDRSRWQTDLDDLFLVEQLSCYPTDYDIEHPALWRLAETIDKLEEDILGLTVAPPRGPRRAMLTIGEPIAVEPSAQDKSSLTALLESRVQSLLNSTRGSQEKAAHAHSP
jgi:hypothetical protein